MRLPVEILYFLGVSITGVVISYHISRTWGLAMPLLPERKPVWFWLGSPLFLILAIPLGIAAMADQGMTLRDVFSHNIIWIFAPMPIFIPTMIAYTLLWYGLKLRAQPRSFGESRWATALAIGVSALLYGVYHLASVNEISTLAAMADEIFITSLIGIGFGTYVVLARSLLVAFLVNWMLNWFVFTPLDTFHPPVWQWPIAVLVLGVVWLVYRYGWIDTEAPQPRLL